MKRYTMPYRGYEIEVSGLDTDWQVSLNAGASGMPLPETKYIVSSSEEAALELARKHMDDFLDRKIV